MRFHSHFIDFQSTVKQHNFLSLQRRYWVISRLWAKFSYSDCKWSRLRNDNKFPRNSSGGLELVVVSQTRLSQQSSNASSKYSEQGKNYGDEGRSALRCRRTRYGHKRVSSVIVHGCMVENGMKTTCGGTRLDLKNEKDEKLFYKPDTL